MPRSTTSSPPAVRGGPAELDIRDVRPDDEEALVDIYLAGARHHAVIDPGGFRVPERADAADRLRRRLEAIGPDHAYVIATLDGVPVGSATLDVDDLPHPGNMRRPIRSAELGIAILEGYRGRGIGRRLIAHLERRAEELALERITLTVSETNVGAIGLYHDLGYEDIGREMRKDIPSTR